MTLFGSSDFWKRVTAECEDADFRQAVKDLVRSNNELRAVMRLAGQRIKAQSIGRKDDELLQKMRKVYAEAQRIAKRFEKG